MALHNIKTNIERFIIEVEEGISDNYGIYQANRSAIHELINQFDSSNLEIYTGNHVYWSGILFEEPWYELEEKMDFNEEDIVRIIVENHFKIIEEDLVFVSNKDSEIQWFFDKYSDGYGGNIPHNIDTIMYRYMLAVKYSITENAEKYGEWID